MSDDPVIFLVARRRGFLPLWRHFLSVMPLLCLATLVLSLLVCGLSNVFSILAVWIALHFIGTFLVLAAIVLVGEPVQSVCRDAGVQAVFLRGDAHLEVVGTGLGADFIVDTVARHSFRSVVPKLGWPAAIMVFLSLLACRTQPDCQWVEVFTRAVGIGAAYWVGAGLAVPWLSYLAQWHSAAEPAERMLQYFAVVMGVLAGAAVLAWSYSLGPLWVVVTSILLYVGSLAFFRNEVIQCWLDKERVRQTASAHRAASCQRPKNPWINCSSSNPIVYRESSKRARNIPFGLLGSLVSNLPVALAMVCIGYLEFFSGSDFYLPGKFEPSYFYLLAYLLCWIQIGRCSVRVAGALVTEAQQKTLEPLLSTELSWKDFYLGWREVGLQPIMQENVAISLGLGLVGYFTFKAPENIWVWLSLCGYLYVGCWQGFHFGLHCSLGEDWRTTQMRLILGLLWSLPLLPLAIQFMVVVLSLFAGGNPDLWLQNNLVEFLMVVVLLLQGIYFQRTLFGRFGNRS